MWTGQGLGHEDGREGDGGSGSSGSMTLGGSPGEEQGGSGTQASWGGVSPWLVLTLSLAWALAGWADRPLLQGDGAGGSRDWLLSPLLCGALGTQCLAGRQAGSSLRALPAVLAALRDTRHHPQTLIHHSLHRPPPGMEKSPAPEGLGSTGTDKTHLRLLLPAASSELVCDHDRSAVCQGPALLLLPRWSPSSPPHTGG